MSKKTEKYYKWKKAYYEKRRENTTNGKKKWLEQDINLLFEFKGTDSELSKILNRSVQSIQVKRSKIIKAESKPKEEVKLKTFTSGYYHYENYEPIRFEAMEAAEPMNEEIAVGGYVYNEEPVAENDVTENVVENNNDIQ